jgi:hypothetical protein
MPRNNETIPFRRLRSVLLDLGFTESVVPTGPFWFFEHAPSNTVFVFRNYRPADHITWADHVAARKLLDEKGLLAADDFEELLHKTTA